ncbi:hypothetical protein [Elioraea tepidiphila]|uniref:hypothetical protein n=1 Tax=Elioraea tepidiphila TaxID=457934 RepID=UPI00035C1E75|nr:hypothetical protein [Elioraea tepidiphila]
MGDALAFEVMIWAPIATRHGGKGWWYLVGMHDSVIDAALQFSELVEEFPSPAVVVTLVESVLNRETGRYHDKIIRARGRMPGIDRRTMRQLDAETRRMLARAFAVAKEHQCEIALTGREEAVAARRGLGRVLLLVSCAVVALAVAAAMPHL